MEDSFIISLTDADGKIVSGNILKYDRTTMLSDFGQQERIEMLKSAYLRNRAAMLRTARRIIRLYTHPDRNDISLFVGDEIASCSNFFNSMENIAKLLLAESCPLADDILNEFINYDFGKAFELEADKETVQRPITNAEILRECKNSKNEIAGMLKTFVEKQERLRTPGIINDLIDAGQLTQEADAETGKYSAIKSPMDFLCWCFENGYEGEINAAFIAEHIKTKCNIETLKQYEREARNITETKRKPRRNR